MLIFLVTAGPLLLFVLYGRRRAIRRWWKTKACPHPDCVGRLPAEPLSMPGYDHVFEKEQCEVCQNWVLWKSMKTGFLGGYVRVKGDK